VEVDTRQHVGNHHSELAQEGDQDHALAKGVDEA